MSTREEEKFLANMFDGHFEKSAEADLGDFMDTLSTEELAEIIGFNKAASLAGEIASLKATPGAAVAAHKKGLSGGDTSMRRGAGGLSGYLIGHGRGAKEHYKSKGITRSYGGLGSATVKTSSFNKIAVAGSDLPELPDSAQGAELDVKQRKVSDNVNKEHLSQVPDRSSNPDPTISFQGEGKTAAQKAKTAAIAFNMYRNVPEHMRSDVIKTAAAQMRKEGFILGGISGYAAQGDPSKTQKSGFLRGLASGLGGGVVGSSLAQVAGLGLQGRIAGDVAGQLIGGYLAGRTARPDKGKKHT